MAPSKTTTPPAIASRRFLSGILEGAPYHAWHRDIGARTALRSRRCSQEMDGLVLKIVVGNKKYSSWSLRAWLVLKHAGVPFEEIVVGLDMPETAASIRKYSPSGRVPALIDGDVTVWENTCGCSPRSPACPAPRRSPREAALAQGRGGASAGEVGRR